jgi:hypothetical protein
MSRAPQGFKSQAETEGVKEMSSAPATKQQSKINCINVEDVKALLHR